MPFGFLKPQTLLDEASVQWMFDVFAWAMRNFDAEVFYSETLLVIPSNEFFPGRADSPQGMANLIFDQTRQYAGMGHWPLKLVPENECLLQASPRVEIKGALRGSAGVAVEEASDSDFIPVACDVQQARNPEAFIATLAHTMARYLGSAAKDTPPGGEENWPHITELLAVFMGFGLMFANSAYTAPKGGCGGCGSPDVARAAFLSQYDITYALAIFSVLKEIPVKQVTPHLKSSLRAFFKKAVRDVRGRDDALNRIKVAGESLGQVV